MAKIIGNTTATPNPKPDWNQVDETKADYIKNKPNIESGEGSGSLQQKSGKYNGPELFDGENVSLRTGEIIPGAKATGVQSVAFGGLRHDYASYNYVKLADGKYWDIVNLDPIEIQYAKGDITTPEAQGYTAAIAEGTEKTVVFTKTDTSATYTSEPYGGATPTSAEGIQSLAYGASSHAYGNWSFAGGKGSKTYQMATVAMGNASQAGMTEEEFNDFYSVIRDKPTAFDNKSLYGQPVYLLYGDSTGFELEGLYYNQPKNSSVLYANDPYSDGGSYTGKIVSINGKEYVEYVFPPTQYVDLYTPNGNPSGSFSFNFDDYPLTSDKVFYLEEGVKENIPKYIALGISFKSYDDATGIITYNNDAGTNPVTYTREEAEALPFKDASGRIYENSYSMAHAFGESLKSKGRNSFTMGATVTNWGNYSFAGGQSSSLSKGANTSFLYGYGCHSTAYDTINIGDKNKVDANYGVALGILNEIPKNANGKYYHGSVLLGYGHKATSAFQTLVGRYSDGEGNIFAIGTGDSKNNVVTRKNAFAITNGGQAVVTGKPNADNHAVRLLELNTLETKIANNIKNVETSNTNKLNALKIKTAGHLGLMGGDYGVGSSAGPGYISGYGCIGLGVRPKIGDKLDHEYVDGVDRKVIGAIALGVDPVALCTGGVAIGYHAKAMGGYDIVLGQENKSGDDTSTTVKLTNNAILGDHNSIAQSFSGVTILGRGNIANRSSQILIGNGTNTDNSPLFAVGGGDVTIPHGEVKVRKNLFEIVEDGRMKLYPTVEASDDSDVTTVSDVKNLVFIVDESFPDNLSEETCKEIHKRISKGMDICIIRSPYDEKNNCTYGIVKNYTRDVTYLDKDNTIVSEDSDSKYRTEYTYSLYLTINGYSYWISFMYDEYVKDGNGILTIFGSLDKDNSGIESIIPNIKYLPIGASPDNFGFEDSVALGDILNGVQDDGTIGSAPDMIVLQAANKLGIVSSHDSYKATATFGDYLYTFSVYGNLLENGEYCKKELIVNSTYLEEQLSNTLKYEHLFKFSLKNNIPAGIYEAEIYVSYIDSSETKIGVGATAIEKVTSVYNHLYSKYKGDIPASGYIVKNGETAEYYSVYKISKISSNGASGMSIHCMNSNSKMGISFMSSVLTSGSVSEIIREI